MSLEEHESDNQEKYGTAQMTVKNQMKDHMKKTTCSVTITMKV